MKQTELKLLCGQVQPNSKVCTRSAYDESGLCYHHSPHTADKRRRYASRGGQRGGRGHLSLRVARREISELKSLVKYLARHTATGTLDLAMIDGATVWNVEKTLELVKVYLQLCQMGIKLGMTEEDSHRLEVLDSEELREGVDAQLSTNWDNETEDGEEEYETPDDPRGGAA